MTIYEIELPDPSEGYEVLRGCHCPEDGDLIFKFTDFRWELFNALGHLFFKRIIARRKEPTGLEFIAGLTSGDRVTLKERPGNPRDTFFITATAASCKIIDAMGRIIASGDGDGKDWGFVVMGIGDEQMDIYKNLSASTCTIYPPKSEDTDGK